MRFSQMVNVPNEIIEKYVKWTIENLFSSDRLFCSQRSMSTCLRWARSGLICALNIMRHLTAFSIQTRKSSQTSTFAHYFSFSEVF